jgi:hypothetical protein
MKTSICSTVVRCGRFVSYESGARLVGAGESISVNYVSFVMPYAFLEFHVFKHCVDVTER